MSRYRAKFLSVVFILIGHFAISQTSTYSNPNNGKENNPYSKFGIGELSNGNNTVLKGMGNITSAFQDAYEVNTDNPASYAFLMRTTYEGGFLASERSITSAASGQSYKTGTASLSYLNIGIPFNSRKVALCIGLRPYSHTFYSLVDTTVTPIGVTQRAYSGDGSINYAFLGVAARHKGFSAGVNVGYMFGTIIKNTSILGIDTNSYNQAYESEFPNYTRIGGIYWKLGLMYEHRLQDTGLVFRIGGTLSLQQSLTEKFSNYQISTHNFGDTTVNDTSSSSGLSVGKLRLPLSFSIGAVIAKTDKWSAGIDFAMTQWSSYHSTPDTTINYGIASSSYKIAIGGEYTPNVMDMRNYFSRVTYRAGLYYGKDYLQLNSTQIPYYGLTIGGSFPLKRSVKSNSHFHGAFDIGRLGTTANGLLKETYVKFSLGISFNDIWFIPRKYD